MRYSPNFDPTLKSCQCPSGTDLYSLIHLLSACHEPRDLYEALGTQSDTKSLCPQGAFITIPDIL